MSSEHLHGALIAHAACSALSTPVVTLYGLPLCHRTSGATCQSPNTASTTPFENGGVSQTTETLTT